jgi:SAM-dependent methyltransferase
MAKDEPMDLAPDIVAHYGTRSLTELVSDALDAAGLGSGTLDWQQLAPLDQFHVRGAAATTELAGRLGLVAGTRVLDVGCGLGGPARHLAGVHGVDVTGIDLNPHYVALATALTERCGMAAQVRHVCADATDLPFEPGSFDVAWTQHVAMNIEDRAALYSGILRVLKPGGMLAIYDVIAAGAEPLHYPVPWARDPAISFVATEAVMRAALDGAGFVPVDWTDTTEAGIAWFDAQQAARIAGAPPPKLSLGLVMGADFPKLTANLAANLREGRAKLVQAVMRRPA